jgi:DNA-binding MarR family transcriptional regulator
MATPRRPLPPAEHVFAQIPCLCGMLHLATRAITRIYAEELGHTGLEVTQHAALRLLQSLGPMTQRELGDRLATEKTTTSRNVALLQRRGWVSIDVGDDRRQRLVTITDRGRATLKDALPHWSRAQDRVRTLLTPHRFDTIRADLASLAATAVSA